MADYLAKLQRKQRAKERKEARERARPKQYHTDRGTGSARGSLARHEELYQQHKQEIEAVFNKIVRYVKGINAAGDPTVVVETESRQVTVLGYRDTPGYGRGRRLSISQSQDKFCVSTLEHFTNSWGNSDIKLGTYYFPIKKVYDKDIAAWVTWAATGRGSIIRFTRTKFFKLLVFSTIATTIYFVGILILEMIQIMLRE